MENNFDYTPNPNTESDSQNQNTNYQNANYQNDNNQNANYQNTNYQNANYQIANNPKANYYNGNFSQPQNNMPNGLDYSPIGVGGYIGYFILFSLPCIGFIMMIVLSFGGTKNINLKNLSRAFLILNIIGFVLSIIFIALIAAGFAGLKYDSMNSLSTSPSSFINFLK